MSDRETTKQKRFVAIFFLSGLAGLAYQIIWAKSFAASIGHEYPAMLAVVTAFMCGMAAGNLILARAAKISPRCYGWLEMLIGLWAIAITLLTPVVESSAFKLLGLSPSPLHHWFVVFTIVFIALFPATTAMGATLPAAERFLATVIHRPSTALLYAANTAGAMLGAILAAFWIMPVFGLRASSFILAALNILCGLAALQLARKTNGTAPTTLITPSTKTTPPPLALRLFLTGLVGIGFEVAIVRGLSQILENTVYTFAVVLATYLAGTAIGAFLYHRAPNSRIFKTHTTLFAALALTSLFSSVALRWMPSLYVSLRLSLGDSLSSVAIAETLVALALILLPCICMGATWSALALSSLQFKPNLAWAVAINTLGAALAPIIFGLILIPLGGIKSALAAVPIAYAAIAGRNRGAIVTLAVALCAIPLATSNRELIDIPGGGRLISLQEGVIGTVAVVEGTTVLDRTNSRVLKFNNRFQMGGTAARIAEQRQTDIPLLLHPNPKRALLVGLGTGISFATAAYYPDLIADGVELVPEIARVMPLFNNDAALRSTNLVTHIADGRRFVRATTNQYDVIVADLFHPAQDGAGFLYTREHFQAIRDRLTDDGLFCQWLPLYQIDLATLEIINRTFETVFPNAQRWLLRFNIDTPVIGLIGWKHGSFATWHAGTVEGRLASDPKLAEHLRSVGLNDSVRLIGCYLGEARPLPSTELNTDANPIVIFRAPAVTFRRADNPAERLLSVIETASSESAAAHWKTQKTNLAAEIPKFILARNIYLHGLAQESRGEHDRALNAFIESAKTSSYFTTGYAQGVARATSLMKSDPNKARAILEALILANPNLPVARDLLNRFQN